EIGMITEVTGENINGICGPQIVGIEKTDQLTTCHAQTLVACTRRPPVLLAQVSQPALRAREDASSPVARAVIHNNDFQILISLIENGINGIRDELSGVIC